MLELSWSQCDGKDALLLGGLDPGTRVEVRPGGADGFVGAPPMAGSFVRDGDDLWFVPRFSFVDGTTYTVSVGGAAAAAIPRPSPRRVPTTEVLGIYPNAIEVPRNLLRLYVQFSAPMSEGSVARHIQLIDDFGDPIVGALLATERELWDEDRRRVTVLLDPARIKRGLVPHREAGYPLETGRSFRLRVESGLRDGLGVPLRAGAERTYRVGGDERRHVDPELWTLALPSVHTLEPLRASFGRPLDHFLLSRCLHVLGPDLTRIGGMSEVGLEGCSWEITPRSQWAEGSHYLVVDPILEDLAGNSVARVFDRDLARPEDAPRESRLVTLVFRPR